MQEQRDLSRLILPMSVEQAITERETDQQKLSMEHQAKLKQLYKQERDLLSEALTTGDTSQLDDPGRTDTQKLMHALEVIRQADMIGELKVDKAAYLRMTETEIVFGLTQDQAKKIYYALKPVVQR